MKRAACWFLLLVTICSGWAWACGPFFPNSFITYGGKSLLDMPEALFDVECSIVLGMPAPGSEQDVVSSLPSDAELWKRTCDTDLDDFRQAVSDKVDKTELEAAYGEFRQALSAFVEARIAEQERARSYYYDDSAKEKEAPKPFDIAPIEANLARFPEEFALYSRGAAAYHNEDYENAAKHFAAVLALPAEQRPYRSTWAAFMLGKTWSVLDPSQAPAFFEQVRALAADGFRDSLNLAADCFGWQARAEGLAGDLLSAMRHYAEYGKDPAQAEVVRLSMAWLCRKIAKADAADPALVQDTLSRQVYTAWLIAHPRHPEPLARWLAALDQVSLADPVAGADRLAWAAYDGGDMASAARWIEHCAPDAPYARWVRAKLLLRDGKIEEGTAIFDELAKGIPEGPEWTLWDGDISYPDLVPARNLACADLGVASIERGDFSGALYALLDGAYWDDAAFVAERLMTTEEVERFVEKHAQDPAFAGKGPRAGNWLYEKDTQFSLLRYLAARRLARQAQWERAADYYPEVAPKGWYEDPGEKPEKERLSGMARELARHFAAANDASLPARVRAEHLFDAAATIREEGMDLMGSELAPDWRLLFLGGYSLGEESDLRERAATFIEHNPDVAARMDDSAIRPDKRFHYRYVAADLMWQCADLLPDNDALTAHALYLGGMYLKKRDPEAADRFYKALVRRNPNLLIAREADKLRWFPEQFTDVVLYQPMPKRISRKTFAAFGAAGALAIAVAGGAVVVLARGRCAGKKTAATID